MPNTLRRPAPRPPPPFNPVVESWLEGLPLSSTKPSREELRQWDLKNQYARRRSSFVVNLVFRSLSLTFAIALVSVTLSALNQREEWHYLVAILVPSVAIIAWDTADFITLCIRRDQGIPPSAHVWADGVLFLGASVGTAFTFMDLIYSLVSYNTTVARLNITITKVAFLLGLMLVHSALYFFFVFNCLGVRRQKQTTPRVMYLPTGEPVVVTSSPYSPNPPNELAMIELSKLQTTEQAATTERQSQPMLEALPAPPEPASPATDEPQSAAAPVPSPGPEPALPHLPEASPAAIESPPRAFRNGVPPRKPIPTGTSYSAPWMAPTHELGEEERARAARGESQAQWMSLHDMGVGVAARGRDAKNLK